MVWRQSVIMVMYTWLEGIWLQFHQIIMKATSKLDGATELQIFSKDYIPFTLIWSNIKNFNTRCLHIIITINLSFSCFISRLCQMVDEWKNERSILELYMYKQAVKWCIRIRNGNQCVMKMYFIFILICVVPHIGNCRIKLLTVRNISEF